MATRRIDWSSGQVYTETTMMPAVSASRGASWVHESPFMPQGWKETEGCGSPSLKHSAMKRILSDQRVLTPQSFATVPWHIAEYLWTCLRKSKKRTLYMWKLFATAYPRQFPGVASYRAMRIQRLFMSMGDYLSLVKSDALRWRLVLTVATEFARVPELVQTTTLQNLVALEMVSPLHRQVNPEEADVRMATLNDRVVRAWSELAQSGAFAHLSILRLNNQKELSKAALRYMSQFPSLRFIIVHNCPGLISSFSSDCTQADGWEVADIPELVQCPRLYDCYTTIADTGELRDQTMGQDIPLLDFGIGPSIHRTNRCRGMAPPICLRRCTESSVQEPAAKRPRVGNEEQRRSCKARRAKKAVMKERRGDVGSMLAEMT